MVKKTLNITNSTVLAHMDKQHNQSKYIEDLVIKDMHGKSEVLTRDDVIKLIIEHSGSKKISTTKDDCVLNSVKSLINL